MQLIPLLLLAGCAMAGPQLGFGNLGKEYEDIINVVQRSQEEMRRAMDDINMEQFIGNEWDVVRNTGSQLGREVGELGSMLGREVGEVGGKVGELGDYIGRGLGGLGMQIGKELGREVGSMSTGLEEGVSDLGRQLARNRAELGGMLEHLRGEMGRRMDPFGHSFIDIFARVIMSVRLIGIVAQGRQSWWEGENVCQQRAVEEREEEDDTSTSGFLFPFHMEMRSCVENEDR